jgi:hypothetical protein
LDIDSSTSSRDYSPFLPLPRAYRELNSYAASPAPGRLILIFLASLRTNERLLHKLSTSFPELKSLYKAKGPNSLREIVPANPLFSKSTITSSFRPALNPFKIASHVPRT